MNVLCRRTERKVFPNYVLVKVFLSALCFLCFAFPVFAQSDVTFVGDDRIGMDVSLQFGGMRTSFDNPLGRVLGGGLRAGYYLGSVFFLDGEIFYDPGVLEPGKKAIMLGGLRVGTVFDDAIGVFAKIRAGAINSKYTSWSDTETAAPYSVADIGTSYIIRAPGYGGTEITETYPVVDIGIIVERYYENNFFARIDIGDYIIPFGDATTYSNGTYRRIGTTHSLGIELGVGLRF